jgi:hypothetical protein
MEHADAQSDRCRRRQRFSGPIYDPAVGQWQIWFHGEMLGWALTERQADLRARTDEGTEDCDESGSESSREAETS